MSQTLVAGIAFVAGMVLAVTDGPRSIRLAAVVCGLALAPAAGSVGGTPAALVPAIGGIGAALLSTTALHLARELRRVPGLDPLVPVVAPRVGLFGPRSVRVIGAVVAVAGASWTSINVEVGGAAAASGSVFAATYIWLVGVVRLLRARSVEELGVGGIAVLLASSTLWILETGPDAVAEATIPAGLAPVFAVCAGWLVGRHRRRTAEETA